MKINDPNQFTKLEVNEIYHSGIIGLNQKELGQGQVVIKTEAIQVYVLYLSKYCRKISIRLGHKNLAYINLSLVGRTR